ncbi:DUF3489 domain-containing protein [Novosphingobium tardum]|uniref:DUF3489 domain-containing protein n=1 Tax=Novosphingobium tardum TaxID=1538021 RepID=A0ABV8RM14_9SPHN
MTTFDKSKPASKRSRKMAREPKLEATEQYPQPKRETKSAEVVAMLQRSEGATLYQLIAATSWLPHTARAALSGLKKKGHTIINEKPAGGERIYRIKSAEKTSR